MDIYVKISFISMFSFFIFNHDFITDIDFTYVVVSNTATDDDTY